MNYYLYNPIVQHTDKEHEETTKNDQGKEITFQDLTPPEYAANLIFSFLKESYY
jgi:hypothetical protein